MNSRRFTILFGILGVCVLGTAVSPSIAATFEQATIRRVVDGNQVYIDGRNARVNDVARSGQQLRTGNTRAELLFDSRATGFMGKSSVIILGNTCFRLSNGSVLVSGPQKACLGSKVLGVRGTTYALSRSSDGSYDLFVLEGTGYVGPEGGYEEESSSERPATAAGDPSGNTTYVCRCEVARFSADGEFVSQGKLERTQYRSLLNRLTAGVDVPTSAKIQDAFSKCYGG